MYFYSMRTDSLPVSGARERHLFWPALHSRARREEKNAEANEALSKIDLSVLKKK
jgi:hypothetical protein